HRIPVSFHHYCRWIVGDQYNLDLYSQLIPSVTGLTFACEDLPERRVAPVETPDARHTFNRLKHRVFWRMGRRNRLVLAESYFPFMRNVRFYLRERQIPLPAFPDDPELMVAADPSGRKKLTLSAGTDPFEKILAKLVPDNIPTNYIEGFGQLRDRTKDLPNLTKAIVASSRLITHDLFKTWAAEQQQRGAAVVDVQHGGQYGSGLWNSDEDHERRVATRFCSWGWSDDDQRIRPTISFKLSQQPLVRPNPKGKILAALMSLPRYCYFMCSIPMAGQLKGYWQDQIAMAQALSERVRRMLQWRLYMIDYGWRESQRLKDAIPGADVSQGSGPLWRQLKSCRLFIGTYNSTAYLETLAGNFPTVLFWNPAHWELRESARFFYDALASNGILHATPREAAAHIEKIADDPSAWWSQPGVQRARERFCAQFARRSPHWQPEWHREFHEAAHG
ncbi:MAG TPA: LIC12162 family protein, partial [Elusimicrobiota bacterium]|nr:LIC12162 family protein [Elusimicrobiota bacterium]